MCAYDAIFKKKILVLFIWSVIYIQDPEKMKPFEMDWPSLVTALIVTIWTYV